MRKPGRQILLDVETEKNPYVMSGADPRAERTSRYEVLLQAITQEEASLARLEADQADSRTRLGTLRAELASLGAAPEIRVRVPIAVDSHAPKTSVEKVKLFRSLFRGREEVFPTRFVSRKTGRPGFGGLTLDATAAALDIHPSTVSAEWAHARVWLRQALSNTEAP